MTDTKEIWKDIEGYEGLYQVSNLGRVKSLGGRIGRSKKGKILCPIKHSGGYVYVNLSKNKKIKGNYIHRLVAKSFIPNPENKPEVNHINGIKTDNRVENLEWVTAKENQLHAVKTGLKSSGCDCYNSILTAKQVNEIRETYIPYSKENNLYTIARKYGVSPGTIKNIINGKSHRSEEYIRPKTKLNKDEREKIRKEYVYGSQEFGSVALARKYKVSSTTILDIVKG